MLGIEELKAIYLSPTHYGSGVGTLFLTDVVRRLELKSRYLWVLSLNQLGRSFYEKNGFSEEGQTKLIKIGDDLFEETRYMRTFL